MQRSKKVLIHVMHDLSCSEGSLGEVLNGLIQSNGYIKSVNRSILLSGVRSSADLPKKLLDTRDELLYTSSRGLLQHSFAPKLAEVEHNFGVKITYARRPVSDSNSEFYHEILLIDVDQADIYPVNALKAWLYEEFGIESLPYEDDEYYDRYVKLAPAALAALRAIGAANPSHPGMIIAHDYPGMPTALAAMMDPLGSFKTIFYVHDVPTIRRMVEHHPGHDTMVYNLMRKARERNFYLHEILRENPPSYQNVLTRAARHCDHIIASSDVIRRELCFLGPELDAAGIDVTYPALDTPSACLEYRQAGKAKLQQYAQNLLGYRPDYIFSHVGPTAVNIGFWRDLRVLEHLDHHFDQIHKLAVYFLVSTNSTVKKPGDIDLMETEWDWPVTHRENEIDLVEREVKTALAVQAFNSRSRNIKAVYINQGTCRALYLGRRVPAEIESKDFIRSSDVVLDQSIYRPHIIPSLEAMVWGGLCVVTTFGLPSSALTWLADKHKGQQPANFIAADYTRLNAPEVTLETIQSIDQTQRDQVEQRVSADVAGILLEKLTDDENRIRSYIEQASILQQQFSWDVLWNAFYLPGLNRAYTKRRIRQIA